MKFQRHSNAKGDLVSLGSQDIPFEIMRVYYIFATSPELPRGFHAHKELEQIMICLSGHCDIILDDGLEKQRIHLSEPDEGLHVHKYYWREMHNMSSDCILLVLASKDYDPDDYIFDYQLFLKVRQSEFQLYS